MGTQRWRSTAAGAFHLSLFSSTHTMTTLTDNAPHTHNLQTHKPQIHRPRAPGPADAVPDRPPGPQGHRRARPPPPRRLGKGAEPRPARVDAGFLGVHRCVYVYVNKCSGFWLVGWLIDGRIDRLTDPLLTYKPALHPFTPTTTQKGLGGIAYLALHTALLLLHRQQRHPLPAHPPAPLTTPLQRLHSDQDEGDVQWAWGQNPDDYLKLAGRYLTAAAAALDGAERRGRRRDVTFVMGGPGRGFDCFAVRGCAWMRGGAPYSR